MNNPPPTSIHHFSCLKMVTRITSSAMLALVCGLCPGIAAAQSNGVQMIPLPANGSLYDAKREAEKAGGKVIGVAPEGKLIVTTRPGGAVVAAAPISGEEPKDGKPLGRGDRLPTPEEAAALAKTAVQVKYVAPNTLSHLRAQVELEEDLPDSVDNSVSQYFPPIRSQSWQGNCTGFTSSYYYNTYTQAKDEGLNPASGDNTQICSPAFLYPLMNGGGDNGAVTESMVSYLTIVGCCSWAMKPYEVGDYTSWPTEAAWIDALKRRTATHYRIGTTNGCTDSELLAIKQHLANGNVAATRADLYDNWYGTGYKESTTGVSNWVLYANGGAYQGGHAVTLVGYDDDRWYYDGVTTRTGAFLAANSWGPNYGTTNTGGVNRGFVWIAYDFFKSTPGCFGVAYYNSDRPAYRPKLYAATGLNHLARNAVIYRGGVGSTFAPAWTSSWPLYRQGGSGLAIDGTKRVAVDLSDGIPFISDYQNISLFTELAIYNTATSDGTISSADFYYDFDGDLGYNKVSSSDPVVTVGPAGTGYATVSFATDALSVSPSDDFITSGTQGGPYSTTRTYYVNNTGSDVLNWQAGSNVTWITLSKTSGALAAGTSEPVQLSINANANPLAAGIYPATVTFTNADTAVAQQRAISLEVVPVAAFAWGTVSSPQPLNVPIDVSLTAVDSYGAQVNAFNGSVSIAGYVGGERSIGTGPNAMIYPMRTLMKEARTQALYLRSELGSGGVIRSVSLYIASPPPVKLNNWTIRMKHTTMTTFNGDSQAWQATGWTIVYQANQTISAPGWFTFNLATPFTYNGSNNLMIDYSFRNTAAGATNGLVRYTNYGTYYSYNNGANGEYGDPLTWSGWSPTAMPYTFRPDIRFLVTSPVPITPTITGSFVNGVWNGQITVLQPATQMFFYADDGLNHSGQSNVFSVVAAPIIQQVTSSFANGAYKAGVSIPISAVFSRPISLSGGTPQLQMETGTVDRVVELSGTSANALNFNYTIQPGDASSDLDYLSSSALNLNGAVVTDAELGVQGSAALPNPGASGSLGASKNLVVDTVAPASSAIVTHDTFAGTTIPVGFVASDDRSGVRHTHVYSRVAGDATFENSGATAVSGAAGTIVFSPPADGRYEVCAIAEDNAGNFAAVPAGPEASVLFNQGANSSFEQAAATGDDVLVFPMTDDDDVTITLTGASAGGKVTVSRTTPLTFWPAHFGHPDKLLKEVLSISGEGLGTGWSASIDWKFDSNNASEIGEPISRVFRFDGGIEPAGVYPATLSDDILSITGVGQFSEWYAGTEAAVPVSLSGFSIE